MKKAQQQKGMEGLRYDVMDVREMTYPDQSFDLIIDKSTIDSLMCSDHPYINTTQMIEEGYRVLKAGAYYLTISYSGSRKEQFLREIVHFEVEERVLKRIDAEGC